MRFASEGELAQELQQARQDFVARTGEMFESDPSFERRVASFLEWYVLDRPVTAVANKTPAKLYIESVADTLTTPDLNRLRDLARTHLSLFEFRRFKNGELLVTDLLSGKKHAVFERRQPVGLEGKDIFEARLVPFDEKLTFSETYAFHPREVRRSILRSIKRFRQEGGDDGLQRVALVHRVAYFANRCERYRHVDPKKIFADLCA